MTEPIPVIQRSRPFSDLFSDAIRHLNVALSQAAPPDLRNASSKSCILHCVLALEAVANSLLSDLDYSIRLREAADRFQPLEKFEFALYHISQQVMDRGSPKVQTVAELFKLRNDYVHPKMLKRDGNLSPSAKQIDFEDVPWGHLRIPREPRRWIFDHAKKVVIATDAFLEYFLFDLCGFDQNRAMATVLPALEATSGPQLVFVVENHRVFLYARKGMGIPLRYLNLEREFDDFVTDSYGTVSDD